MTATTFDPSTKTAAVVMSNGNLTGHWAAAGGGDAGVQGFVADALTSGKYYFEFTCDTFIGGDTGIGICTAVSTYPNLGNNGTVGAICFPSGNLYINGTNSGNIITGITNGQIVAVAIDFTAHLIWMKDLTGGNWNNSGTANPATGVGGRTIPSGTFVPALVFASASTAQMTANFGATAFTGTVPSGFTSGWPAAVTGVTGTMASTEAPDIMVATGFPLCEGTMNLTERADSWSTSQGYEVFGIENAFNTASGGALTGFTFSTNGPDRIVVITYSAVSVIGSPVMPTPIITGISDTAGLEWHSELEVGASGGTSSDSCVMQIWWAYAHNKLVSDTVTVTFSNTNTANRQMTRFAVKGLNGNYNHPWDAMQPTAFGSHQGAFSGSPSQPTSVVPLATGPGDGSPYPSIVFTMAMSVTSTFFGVVDNLPGYTVVGGAQGNSTGSQRNTAFAVAYEKQDLSIKFVDNDVLTWPGNEPEWVVAWDTLVIAQPVPGVWNSTEAPDTCRMIGYTGAFGVVGFMDLHEAPDTAAIFGFERDSGVLFAVEAPDVFSAYGYQPLRGTLAVTEAPDRFAATGLGRGENGVWMSTEAVDIFAAIGNTPISGTFVTTEAPDRFLAIGAGVTRVRRRRTTFVT